MLVGITWRYYMLFVNEFSASNLEKKLKISSIIDKDSLSKALLLSKSENVALFKVLLNIGAISEVKLLSHCAEILGASTDFSLKAVQIDFEAANFLGSDYLKRNHIIPLKRHEGLRAIITADLDCSDVLKMVDFTLEETTHIIFSDKTTILKFLLTFFPDENVSSISNGKASANKVEELKALANQAPVVRFVQDILSEGIERNASDIHFEANEAFLNIRFRIDGDLTNPRNIVDLNHSSVISRLKVMADMNISERKQPQDGRISHMFAGRKIDLRLATIPTQYGEGAVLRILDQAQLQLNWTSLGFKEQDIKSIQKIIHQPNGLFLVTGPTGSGKTTTLYTALSELNTPNKKLFTVEDPIEYSLDNVTQIQVKNDIKFTFATALRSILRQDPNIIMIGEIRDLETAEIACRAALVGRMVLSTLHTSSAAQAATRLKDLGVADYLIKATLKGVLEQTLDPRKCIVCDGDGCSSCNQTGLGARQLKYSLLQLD